MAASSSNGNGNGYTIKEMIDEIVIPKLNQVSEDVAMIKENMSDRVQLISEFRSSQADIQTLKEFRWKVIGMFVILVPIISFASAIGTIVLARHIWPS